MPARLVSPMPGRPAITLDKAIMLIGRHPDCDIVLTENRKVSRRHCCIAQVNDRFVIRDLGSMNGIRVNDEEVVEAVLREGDKVLIGDEEFELQTRDKPKKVPRTPLSSSDSATAEKSVNHGLPPLPFSKKPPLPPTPADISQEFPVVIPENPLAPEPVAIADTPHRPLPFLVDLDDDMPHILKLDSGEINLRDLDAPPSK